MTSQKQIDANRRNALLSTGPQTENGKQRSRGNSYRHGLTAETVIVGVEDAAEYGAFESEIIAEYDPKSVVERELTHRLASLLWRLRRAGLIETGLLRIASEHAQDRDEKMDRMTDAPFPAAVTRWISAPTAPEPLGNGNYDPRDRQLVITKKFLQVADMSGQPLERVGRYESSLWRLFLQALFALDQAKYHRIAASRGRFTPHAPQW